MTSHRSLDAVGSIRRRAAFGPCARPVRVVLGPATIGRFSAMSGPRAGMRERPQQTVRSPSPPLVELVLSTLPVVSGGFRASRITQEWRSIRSSPTTTSFELDASVRSQPTSTGRD
jgi:hypothetical protein